MAKTNKVQQVLSNKGDAIDEPLDQALDTGAPDEAQVATPTREDRIRLAAYAAAERRGFEAGFADEDWLAAEREIDAQMEDKS